jgi:thiamine-monophosphate kinase
MAISEFDLIQAFFKQATATRTDVTLGIGDDAALLCVPPGQHLVATTDTLVSGHHFPENTSPYDIGYKALAVNLSDLAAMGAEPAWILLALTLPTADESWLKQFAQGFFSLIQQFHCQLVGGDVSRGPLSITVQALGFVPRGKALLRSGAQVGDTIYVSGTLGDAGLALDYLQQKIVLHLHKKQQELLLAHLNTPQPRIELGLALRDIASSAIDISDGLAADLGHILAASQLGATLYIEKLPLSECLQEISREKAWQYALSAGDDYELCFTVPEFRKVALQQLTKIIPCAITCIGVVKEQQELSLYRHDGSRFVLKGKGFQHF